MHLIYFRQSRGHIEFSALGFNVFGTTQKPITHIASAQPSSILHLTSYMAQMPDCVIIISFHGGPALCMYKYIFASYRSICGRDGEMQGTACNAIAKAIIKLAAGFDVCAHHFLVEDQGRANFMGAR